MNPQFDTELCARYVQSLVDHDEVERALFIIDNVPAFYRDNLPTRLQALRANILSSMVTPHAYMTEGLDCAPSVENSIGYLTQLIRGKLIKAEVEDYNRRGLTPHIVDVGPGEYNIPIGLKKLGLKFTYFPVGFDEKAKSSALDMISSEIEKVPSSGQPCIFVANEIIEHLPSPQDLLIEALRHCLNFPERIHLSTPMYTYDVKPRTPGERCALPHLRAYTPNEFYAEANKMFRGYKWGLYQSPIMSLRGMRCDKIGDDIKLE